MYFCLYNKIKIYPMKRHHFYFEFLSQSCLVGLCISQFETRLEDQQEWLPAFKIELGFIFFTISYTKVSI